MDGNGVEDVIVGSLGGEVVEPLTGALPGGFDGAPSTCGLGGGPA
jgi:hypothetical protein